VLLVVLTGMGKDGLEGAAAVKRAGGRVLAEAESTCTVYGMPRAVADAGLADAVLPLDRLAGAIAREL
jgi:two-component system chemotaxis response regulator CheB